MRNIGDNISDIRGAPLSRNADGSTHKQHDNESYQAKTKKPVRPDVVTLHDISGKPVKAGEGQAKKSTGWMPWHQEPMKDVTSCDKPWGGANIP